ncbi:GNAT family N-acetyltransferase [Smaragdicoccus niigatensis]|uniref:GNAT family N-acetyltransferase n=1 Tax=Smaragdicoccus niigatensis TaxID=359359 RepID=UPI000360F181|nr:GNAT family N-acetyltransferase [Smaragdicoccus niigatensis]
MSAWTVRRLTAGDGDLALIAEQVNGAAMEIGDPFTEASLQQFLTNDDAIYLTIHHDDRLVGALHGFAYLHPSGKRYVYVDEVDTAEDFRRRGVAKKLMEAALDIARDLDAESLWLGTDDFRDPAKKLYQSLNPSAIEPGSIYSWDFD